ncbi:MAG TPA: CcoQ/FixQ family Cbb3-type cytochrome c oxidase assembly chaperone [Anaeromyxobacteraceae bacterium]|nr:CcoQ/FixQ family Cbb3-type cytochrome c oxidase assembly chaperone [Anaeromyxobacteraceae bacterium]
MTAELAYLVFGLTLCAALAGIAFFTYRRHRKDRVEAPKHAMLKDDE